MRTYMDVLLLFVQGAAHSRVTEQTRLLRPQAHSLRPLTACALIKVSNASGGRLHRTLTDNRFEPIQITGEGAPADAGEQATRLRLTADELLVDSHIPLFL